MTHFLPETSGSCQRRVLLIFPH